MTQGMLRVKNVLTFGPLDYHLQKVGIRPWSDVILEETL